MYFGLSPIAGTILAIFLIVYLIGLGIKSAGKSFTSTDYSNTPSFKEIRKELGPMTWQERIVGIIIIVLFVCFVIWLALIT